MSVFQVAVVAGDSGSGSGTAVVRISGLMQWPDNATLRILPIDEVAVPPNSEGWPWDAIKPLRVEATESGIDVVLGPDVVGSARLLPGTPITIKVGAANLEVEARWPSVGVTRRRAGAVAMSAAQLLAAKAEREKVERLAAARRQELAEFAARSARDAAADAQQVGKEATGTTPNRKTGAGSGREAEQLSQLVPLRRPATSPTETPPTLPWKTAASSLGQLARLDVASPDEAPTMPAPRTLHKPPHYPAAFGFLTGLVTAAAVAMAIVTLVPPPWLPGALSAARIAPTSLAQIGAADLESLFRDLASAGAQSPGHKTATNVDVATALSLADHSLKGQRTEAETAEAEFWLKRALATSFGGADIGWAMTQLGTIYAANGSPRQNYSKAHAIWELAAAQGDPMAHCFLGALFEHGLGVPKSRKVAREHYLTADALGACRSAKEAAARLND